jgi:hypothetical protein
MSTSKAAARSDSGQMATREILERQQELMRELHALLTNYGPTWYTEEIDSRLSETLAMSTSHKKPVRRPTLHCLKLNRHKTHTAL